jgi:hypothetical protein
MARRKSNVEKGFKRLSEMIDHEQANSIMRAEINYMAKVSRIAMIARGGLFKVPIPKARSLAPRPMPGETYRRAQARRASELRAGMKSKGMNSVLKAATKGDIPGQYTTGRYLRITEPCSWSKNPTVTCRPEWATLSRKGNDFESEIDNAKHSDDTVIEAIDQFSHAVQFGVDTLERLDKEQEEADESKRLEEKLERSIEAAEEELERKMAKYGDRKGETEDMPRKSINAPQSVVAIVREAGFDIETVKTLDVRQVRKGMDTLEVKAAVRSLGAGEQLLAIVNRDAGLKDQLFALAWDWKDVPEHQCAVVLFEKEWFDRCAGEAA